MGVLPSTPPQDICIRLCALYPKAARHLRFRYTVGHPLSCMNDLGVGERIRSPSKPDAISI